MKLYRFSPINNAEECSKVLEYIAMRLKDLSELVLDEQLPINTLKIFAHYQDEYALMKSWVDTLGESADEDSATSYYVKPAKPLVIDNNHIELAGIRIPDPYRSQVGCGDFKVDEFDRFKAEYIDKSPYVREVPHPKYEMLEIFHPDLDVLGYVVNE